MPALENNLIATRIRDDGRLWIMKQKFWLFGTATFFHGENVSFEEATRHGRRFFNALDRRVLPRKQVNDGRRLQRLVFVERGRTRANTHIHFFVKGFEWSHYHAISEAAEQLWPNMIEHAADIELRDNVDAYAERAGYCWKEVRSDLHDVLMLECCHLD